MFAFWVILVDVTASSFVVQIDKLNPELEFQETMYLNCNATGCPGQTSITWRVVDDKPFKPIKEEQGFVSFKSQALTNLELVCTAQCEAQRVQKKTRIVVYSFPNDPEISGGDRLTVDVEQSLTCTARDIYPADDVFVQWLHRNRTFLDSKPQLTGDQGLQMSVSSNYTFIPTAQDNGGNVTCKVIQNIVPGYSDRQKIRKRTMALIVNRYYLKSAHISGQRNLTIGETLTLTCNSDGNPRPVMVWTKAGKVLDITDDSTVVINNVTWSHAGQYDCESNNTKGSVKSSVTVIIQGPPSSTQVRVSPSVELMSGQNVTITCTTLSFPPATFTLFRQGHSQPLQAGDGTFHLLHVTSKDTGLYLVNASNHLGSSTETFQLSVASSPVLPTAVLPAVGSVSFLSALLLLLRCLRSRKDSADISTGIVDVVENAL